MSKAPELPKKLPAGELDRHTSVDSETYFEDDGFGDYDFKANAGKGRGGGSGGGERGSGDKKSAGKGVYTAKHIRAKEAMRQNQKSAPKK